MTTSTTPLSPAALRDLAHVLDDLIPPSGDGRLPGAGGLGLAAYLDTALDVMPELKAMVAAMEADFIKFYNDGNKAAGTRVRGAMQDLKNFAQTVRTEVQAKKNEKA